MINTHRYAEDIEFTRLDCLLRRSAFRRVVRDLSEAAGVACAAEAPFSGISTPSGGRNPPVEGCGVGRQTR